MEAGGFSPRNRAEWKGLQARALVSGNARKPRKRGAFVRGCGDIPYWGLVAGLVGVRAGAVERGAVEGAVADWAGMPDFWL